MKIQAGDTHEDFGKWRDNASIGLDLYLSTEHPYLFTVEDFCRFYRMALGEVHPSRSILEEELQSRCNAGVLICQRVGAQIIYRSAIENE